MNRLRQMFSGMMIVALVALSVPFSAQTQTQVRRPYRLTNRQIDQIIRRVEVRADRFRSSLDAGLDQSRIDGSTREDNINELVHDFEDATDDLRARFNSGRAVAPDVESVLLRASRINDFMQRSQLAQAAENDWALLRTDLTELARAYSIRWSWEGQAYEAYPPADQDVYDRGTLGGDSVLTGTYRLDPARSDNPRTAADRVTRSLPANQRQRIYNDLINRIEPPEMLAIERRGRNITIASSRAQQIAFEADGRERVEEATNGQSVRARAILYGDRLEITSASNMNRGFRETDYSVTFDPINNGRSLRVTRRFHGEQFREPVIVQSTYNRTSTVAQWNVYGDTRNPTYTGSNRRPDNRTDNRDFVIQNGTTLVAVLDSNITTRESREGDRFMMTVREPSQFSGAVIEGYISSINPSGRVSGRSQLDLNFERIRMRDGRTYKFAGLIESVRTVGGETVRVDNEGSVQEGDSQTERTVKRAAIGTAIGAIIGAIAGGGKGAAIGAVVGGGAGAGSIYAQGRDELELMSGTEVTIRATSPNDRNLQ